jgi:hypothetical protein
MNNHPGQTRHVAACIVMTATLGLAFAPSFAAGKGPATTSQCRTMSDLSSIPKGWHPVTAQWNGGDPDRELVCFGETKGKEIQVLQWKHFALPPGYVVLHSDGTTNERFRGCAEWTTWQGQSTCVKSWTVHRMRRQS